MSIPQGNEALSGITDIAMVRELAIRKALRTEEYRVANREAVEAALTPLFDLVYHRPKGGCSDSHPVPMNRIIVRNRDMGFDSIACPACYLIHLDDDFAQNWLDSFMVQLKAVEYESPDREAREVHIAQVLEDIDALLPLTFHPNRAGCSDEAWLSDRRQFSNGREVECVRCFLLGAAAEPDNWDPRYQLRVNLWNIPPIHIPDVV